ncbi:QacE family quaternary ammonium compound efflux SMR transporter [Deltaproteobacteria bacterium OttesenSCG-928-M10]|nr:QacE family quaternary ammonium compound efflux SMR transporter [Deltaproteobacteria bacterium OttesenSCG-928-M10]
MSLMTKAYLFLTLAICLEVTGTSLLKISGEFTRPLPTIGLILCYLGSFYCLSLVLRTMNIGVAYAIWCAAGIVLVSAVGLLFFKQELDLPAVIGLGMIVAGVLVVNLFSKTVSHG